MATDQVIQQLLEVFSSVVGEDAVHGPDTARGDMEVWDSLAQVRLVYAVERAFDVELPERLLTSEVSLLDIAAAVVDAQKAKTP
ncbi:acyl carrier protein [Nocardia sp. CDC159]|uniref:Acyl carrier protein n=1 Tax=Nocardia pulmonis TaxID=2951408 RepID=A0A9X2IZY8_9NOCA|nr:MULTISPECIES: acyl carrier protein [Nocardia]MCM6778627.1 acyl carrier protein [Nocardia pulmonis]MCM6791516.1 acyl carrier protein [Nocardia sp. CDC159]